MFTLINIEILKIFKKWRTYIGFIAIGGLTLFIQFILFSQGDSYIERFISRLNTVFMVDGNLLNGYFIGHSILNALYIHVPFLITLVGGDILASEATAGTYRMLVTRPISRNQILSSKFLAGFIYVFSLLTFLAGVSLFLSLLIFGSGDLFVFGSPAIIFSESDVMWRFLCAYGYAVLSMMTVYTISFFFSSLVENAVGPIMTTMAIIIVFLILSNLDFEILNEIKPYLFTNYLSDWRLFFSEEIDYSNLIKSASVLLLHIVGLFGITTFFFNKKDILS